MQGQGTRLTLKSAKEVPFEVGEPQLLTIVASCLGLAVFLILPIAKHKGFEAVHEMETELLLSMCLAICKTTTKSVQSVF